MLFVAHPGKRRVAPFGSNAVAPVERAAIDHDAAADAGAENRAEHDARAARRAVDRLGEREAVGVVREAYLAPQASFEVALERLAVVGRVVRVADDAGLRRNHARHADTDRASRFGFALSLQTLPREVSQ